MSEVPETSGTGAEGISRRSAEMTVAVLLFALGGLVVFDSYRLGSSWGPDGPEAGYFPFYIGLFICIAAAVNFYAAAVRRGVQRDGVFVEWQALSRVLAVLVPAVLYVLGIQLIGLYVASAIYIAGFMRRLGNYGWVRSVLVGVGVSAAAFATFEIWFQVPLYKGAFDPLAFLGY